MNPELSRTASWRRALPLVRRRWVPTLLASLTLALGALAQSPGEPTGAVLGTVSNAATGAPLSRAKVAIRGTTQETLTDDDGRFQLRGAPAREIELEVSYLGFGSQTSRVTVPPGGQAARDLQLSRAGTDVRGAAGELIVLEKFQVVAEQTMSGQAVAMNVQRHAANITNVVSFDELGDRGQENIGDYVRFLPGVTILDDGTNPGRIALGGFPAEMSNLQIDGVDVPATGIGPTSTRAAALQDVPILNIERVEVSKVPTPDLPASGLGGSMNLIAKTGTGLKRPVGRYQVYLNFDTVDGLSLGGGARQPHDRASPRHKQPSFSLSYAFPLGKTLAVSLGGSRSWRQRPTDDTPSEVAFWNLRKTYLTTGAPKDLALAITQWRQEASISRTENLQLGLDWRPTPHDTLSLQVQDRAVSERKAQSFMTARVSAGYDAIGNADFNQSRGTTGSFEMGTLNPSNFDATTDTRMISLKHVHRGPRWNLDAQASYSAADRERSSLGKGYFNGVLASILQVNIRGDGIGRGSSIGPQTYTITRANGTTVDPYNAANYTLGTANEEYARYQTDTTSGRLNVSRAIGRHLTLKLGGAYNRLDKDDTRPVKNYTFVGRASGQTAVSLYDLVDESIDVKVNGNPTRWISPVKAHALFVEHPEYFTLNTTYIQNLAQNSKRMLEEIAAGYLRFDLRLLSGRLNLTGGARYEETELKGWSMKRDNFAIYQRDAAGNLLRNSSGALIPITNNTEARLRLINQERGNFERQGYGGLYPSLNANYALTENLVARAAYARTLGRPDVQYVVAGITVPVPTDTNPTTARTIVVGNPGLEPWTADSFHLSLDSYHLKGGFGSVGIYRKNVRNFFAQRGRPTTAATLEAYGIPEGDIELMLADNYVLRRWENVGDATLDGLELSYRQDLRFLPSWLQLVQAWVNYTRLRVGGPNAPDFVGFSPASLTAGLNYIRPRFSVRLTAAYQAETKRAEVVVVPGTSTEGFIPPSTYDYQAASTRYGISAEYALTRNFALYLNWDDVFARDRFLYRRAPDTPAFAQNAQRLVSPSFIVLGLKGSF